MGTKIAEFVTDFRIRRKILRKKFTGCLSTFLVNQLTPLLGTQGNSVTNSAERDGAARVRHSYSFSFETMENVSVLHLALNRKKLM